MGYESDCEISDGEIDDVKHEKLVAEVLSLNKIQNVKKASRTEPATEVSEFNLIKSIADRNGSVRINELTETLRNHKKHPEISKVVKLTSGKSKTLPTPLYKPQAEQIRRTVNYEKSRLQLDRWEGVVASNRAAATITFPLNSVEKLKIIEANAEVFPTSWRVKSDLQKELESLQPKKSENKGNKKTETYHLTLEELKERRKEVAKLRAHQSFKEAKARQQNKIKSKKYHRILKREKIKQKLKEFEELQKTDPEEAAKKLEDIEKARAEERFSLRHKGTGQWARSKEVRAKYDKESRQVLSQQLAISRELTQKLKTVNSDSEHDDDNESTNERQRTEIDKNNPWVNGMNPEKEVIDFLSGYKQYWTKHNKEMAEEGEKIDKKPGKTKRDEKIGKKLKKTKQGEKIDKKPKKTKVIKKKVPKSKKSLSTSEWVVSHLKKTDNVEDIFEQLEEKLQKTLKRKYDNVKGETKRLKISKARKNKSKRKVDLTMPTASKKQVIDEELIEKPVKQTTTESDEFRLLQNVLNSTSSQENSNINPEKFIEVKKTVLNTALPDILTASDEEATDHQRDIILEAFEDDDIAGDFKKEKSDVIDKDTPKDIDLSLPGWGSWAGADIKPSKRKKKRFILKMPAKMPRKDDNKGSLIINEKAQSKIRPLLVAEVPFPFKTVKDYEASIRAPIGNTFVPETAFRKFVEPAVTTKMGAIIEPISKSVLIGKKNFNI